MITLLQKCDSVVVVVVVAVFVAVIVFVVIVVFIVTRTFLIITPDIRTLSLERLHCYVPKYLS